MAIRGNSNYWFWLANLPEIGDEVVWEDDRWSEEENVTPPFIIVSRRIDVIDNIRDVFYRLKEKSTGKELSSGYNWNMIKKHE